MTHIIGREFPIPENRIEQDIEQAAELFGEPFAQELEIEYTEIKRKPMYVVDMLIVFAFTLGVIGGMLLGLLIAIRLGL